MKNLTTSNFQTTSVPWISKSISGNTTYYTDGFDISRLNSEAAVLATVSNTNMSIDYQLSYDNENFYTPVNNSLASTSLILNGSIATSRYIVFSPKEAGSFLRFNISTLNTRSVTATFIFKEDLP